MCDVLENRVYRKSFIKPPVDLFNLMPGLTGDLLERGLKGSTKSKQTKFAPEDRDYCFPGPLFLAARLLCKERAAVQN